MSCDTRFSSISLNLLYKSVTKFQFQNSRINVCRPHASDVATREPRGPCPPNGGLCPHLSLLKILFLEHYSVIRQHTMMEKGISTFKHYSPLTFSPFFLRNCWQPTAKSHTSDAIFSLINTPLRMCRER